MGERDGAVLVVEDVTKEYGHGDATTRVLDGVNLRLNGGDTAAILGPSGSGKTTLLNIIGSLDKPTSGSVTLNNLEVTALDDAALAELRSRRVGFVFQDHHLLPQLTALENVLLPTLAVRSGGTGRRFALDLLDRVGVADRADSFPSRMSGGERQRTAVARALVNNPILVLCDEPTGNLDRESGMNVIHLLLGLAEDKKITVITVTHNVEHAERFAKRYGLERGKLVSRST